MNQQRYTATRDEAQRSQIIGCVDGLTFIQGAHGMARRAAVEENMPRTMSIRTERVSTSVSVSSGLFYLATSDEDGRITSGPSAPIAWIVSEMPALISKRLALRDPTSVAVGGDYPGLRSMVFVLDDDVLREAGGDVDAACHAAHQQMFDTMERVMVHALDVLSSERSTIRSIVLDQYFPARNNIDIN